MSNNTGRQAARMPTALGVTDGLFFAEAPPPIAHCLIAASDPARDLSIAHRLMRQQQNPRALDFGKRCSVSAREFGQGFDLLRRQLNSILRCGARHRNIFPEFCRSRLNVAFRSTPLQPSKELGRFVLSRIAGSQRIAPRPH